MSTFDAAIGVVLLHEGGWVSNPADPGGETNFGISTLIVKRIQAEKRLTDAQVEQMLGVVAGTLYRPDYMKTMKVDAAKAIYRQEFWDRYHYGDIADQRCATKVFDCAVNCGPARAGAMAQRAANSLGKNLVVDGSLGPASFAGINGCHADEFLQAMKKQMEDYYSGLVAAKPTLGVFLKNWLHRAAWIG